jgi:hypothetical protein
MERHWAKTTAYRVDGNDAVEKMTPQEKAGGLIMMVNAPNNQDSVLFNHWLAGSDRYSLISLQCAPHSLVVVTASSIYDVLLQIGGVTVWNS